MNALELEMHGLVYDASLRPANERVAFFTSLCRLASGTLLCAFQCGSAKHSPDAILRICRSIDDGATWTLVNFDFKTALDGVPGSLTAPALAETSSGRLLLFATWFDRSDPQRPLFDPSTQGILHSRLIAAYSHDGGASWSDWRILAPHGLSGCAGTGPILRWPNGTLALAFESFKEYDDLRPGRHAAWLLASRDDGETFSPPLLVARDPQHRIYYWDQRLCVTGQSGEFAGMFWTHDATAQCDQNVHFCHGNLAEADALRVHATGELLFGNSACAHPRDTSIQGQITAPLQLSDGRILALAVCRHGPCTMALWQSFDQGASWRKEDSLVVYEHEEKAPVASGGVPIEFNQYWEDMGKWSFGHPAMIALDARHVLCAYYAGTPDCMSIHWARVRT